MLQVTHEDAPARCPFPAPQRQEVGLGVPGLRVSREWSPVCALGGGAAGGRASVGSGPRCVLSGEGPQEAGAAGEPGVVPGGCGPRWVCALGAGRRRPGLRVRGALG